jgi:hypothetical protein
MKVYNYHQVTKIFTCEDFADPDPLEQGSWLLPANATFIQPPALKEYEVSQFNEEQNKWTVVDVTPNYYELRQKEYPSIYDIIDGIVKNDEDQINKYIEQCKAVKAKYPKPNEF